MKNILICSLLLCLLSGPVLAFADVTNIGVSARPLGMGKAFLGFSDDASCLLLNPAALGRIDSLKLTSMAGTLISEIGLLSFGGAYPTPYGTFGGAVVSSSLPGINLTRIVGGTVEVYGQTDYSNSATILTYANGLDKMGPLSGALDRFLPVDAIAIGANLKLYNQQYSNQSGTLSDLKGTGMEMDFSVLYEFVPEITLGASLLNALPASLGGKFVWQRNNIEEGIPALLKLGAVYRPEERISIAVDLDSWVSQSLPQVWHLGGEYWITDNLALRAGLDQLGDAVRIDNNLSLGVGIRSRGVTFDYAYHQYGTLDEDTTHYFSLGYLGPEKEADKAAVKKPEPLKAEVKEIAPAAPPAAPQPPPPYRMFSDVPEDFWAYQPIIQLASLKILSGYPDGTFKPDKALTRAELAALLVRAKESDPGRAASLGAAKSLPFTDVSISFWAAPFIAKAVEQGYVSGYPDRTFKPNKTLTLAEAIKVFTAFDGLLVPLSIAESPVTGLSPSHWAATYVYAAKQAGYIDYIAEGTFVANQPFTRAEAAYLLSKTAFGKEKIMQTFKTGQ